MPSFPTLLLIFVLAHPSFALIIHIAPSNQSASPFSFTDEPTSNITTNLNSIYSTLGTRPSSLILRPLVLLSNADIDDEKCTCSANVSDKIVILNGYLPLLSGCNMNMVSRAVALVRILESRGAIAVVLPAQEAVRLFHFSLFPPFTSFARIVHFQSFLLPFHQSFSCSVNCFYLQYMNGRMTGFSTVIKIPVLVSPNSVISFIAHNAKLIDQVELSPISRTGNFLFCFSPNFPSQFVFEF